MKKILLIISIFSLIGVSSAIGSEATIQGVEQIELRVDGLACPFCSKGLGMRLKKVERVADATISLEKGLAEIRFERENPPNLHALWNAVEEAGFTPSKLRIEAVGKIQGEKDEQQLSVMLSDHSFIIPLENNGELIEKVDTTENLKITASAKLDQGPRFALESAEPTTLAANH